MPCDYKQYPENWKWLSKQIVSDAGNKCELCYAPNGAFIQRIKGAEYPWYKIENTKPNDKFTKIILTVHHINHDKKDNTKQNLIALCQKCHLRLDLAHHMKNRRESRRYTQESSLHLATAETSNLICECGDHIKAGEEYSVINKKIYCKICRANVV